MEDLQDGQYDVIGVTKGGKGCGVGRFPGLYSSTIHYRAWILHQRAAWVKQEENEEWAIKDDIYELEYEDGNECGNDETEK